MAKIKYAGPAGADGGTESTGVQYYDDAMIGGSGMLREQDDPMHEMYVPLTERSEPDKARWFARHGARRQAAIRKPRGIMRSRGKR